ncbi:unnamed protein product [Nippostrongylus brasiliensis]|uniref:Uncharacterized protein n=1 Tax=Nippostrongylus brasiliensis TaxID=27835 RepID=A0A0N4Y9U0_NIPBR|nr:unnamed protein product [Nippostrongylus brasiliensis]
MHREINALLQLRGGIQSEGIMKCAFFNEWHELCDHLIVAYNDNEDAIRDLREEKYKDDKKRLQDIDRDITKLLKMKPTNKLRVSCNVGSSVVMTIYCEDALYFAALATYELVLAIMEYLQYWTRTTVVYVAHKSTYITVIKEGVLSNGNLQCAYKQQEYCDHLLTAYAHNKDAILELVNDTLRNNRERIRNTNSAILEVLNLTVENKSELFNHLHKPMHRQVNALFQLRVTCDDERRKGIEYGDALIIVPLAILELALAIQEVAEGDQQKAIKNALESFKAGYQTRHKAFFQLGYELGTAVMEVI